MGEVDYTTCPSVLCQGSKVLPISRYGKGLELAQGIIQKFFHIPAQGKKESIQNTFAEYRVRTKTTTR